MQSVPPVKTWLAKRKKQEESKEEIEESSQDKIIDSPINKSVNYNLTGIDKEIDEFLWSNEQKKEDQSSDSMITEESLEEDSKLDEKQKRMIAMNA